MAKPLRLAVAGVGNNISALLQGIYYYRTLIADGADTNKLPGIRHFKIGDFAIGDIELVAAFDVQPEKIGLPIEKAIFCAPNNYPNLGLDIPHSTTIVHNGVHLADKGVMGQAGVATELRQSEADVLLYSLPTGLQRAADAYAECALEAGVSFVNCTPEAVARNPEHLQRFEERGLSLIGDDLASHMGTSMLHRAILDLLINRGLTLENTYQLNLGGNEDFRNLQNRGESKTVSKRNALARTGLDMNRVHVIPSAGVVPHLQDRKVAYLNVIGRGWANMPISIDLKLEVQDSSNAAGVIIDLIRIAASARRRGLAGFNAAAASFLKSPPHGHLADEQERELAELRRLNAACAQELV
ncbi:inositol-3-phosphate synthase [Bradyrhizobium sp. CB1717]|uniref:inositol-3-phosphate synthase n=1 Tax=Bradyrhizobium sp. CB1717 TaxID=3039154 RepID=UPI0024B13505|nr:inositol-3-phosphate synthase [Bradyrhizobium sp. CB1717]WFU25158.1 inositol-3-phosphate synthase [Bradyrhizobium sp. CB1717]